MKYFTISKSCCSSHGGESSHLYDRVHIALLWHSVKHLTEEYIKGENGNLIYTEIKYFTVNKSCCSQHGGESLLLYDKVHVALLLHSENCLSEEYIKGIHGYMIYTEIKYFTIYKSCCSLHGG